MSNQFECPACSYVKRTGGRAGQFLVCPGCLKIVHVQPDLTFRVVRLADAPEDQREGLAAMSGEEL